MAMGNSRKIRKKEQELVLNQVNKHKKALGFVFFNDLPEEPCQVRELVEVKSCQQKDRIIIVFEGGRKVLYQKEKLTLERSMNKYVAWMNQSVLKDKKLYCRKLLEYPDCSFLEMIHYQKYRNAKERKDYYYRMGSLMALIVSLGGDFLTYPDMVGVYDQPILDNLECLRNHNICLRKNMPRYEELENSTFIKCKSEEQAEMQRGYNAIYNYVFHNMADTREAIKLFFNHDLGVALC